MRQRLPTFYTSRGNAFLLISVLETFFFLHTCLDNMSVVSVRCSRHIHTVQRLMLSKGAKRTIFYHITVIMQYCWDKTIAWSGDMHRDDFGIFTLVIICFGITNTSVQNFATRISSVKTVPKCLQKLKVFFNKFTIDVSFLLISSLLATVICQKYFGIMWFCLKSIFLHLYLRWGVVLCDIGSC